MHHHYFAGGNTGKGFVHYFPQLWQEGGVRRTVALKGGPGVGKSTLMKRAAQHLAEMGEPVDFIHCSSDPESLDAICTKQAAIVDGTAPHIVDPRLPGAEDSLLNLGEYLDEAALAASKPHILQLNREISACFAACYRLLAAAEALRPRIQPEDALLAPIHKACAELLQTLPQGSGGRLRPVFFTAITPRGQVNYLPEAPRRIVIRAGFGQDTTPLIQTLAQQAVWLGHEVWLGKCALNPDRSEHMFLKNAGLLISTENAVHACAGGAELHFDLTQAEPERYEQEMSARLVGRAVGHLAEAKRLHDELEQFYIRAMDYTSAEAACARMLEHVYKSIR